jgi:beta-lactamase class A
MLLLPLLVTVAISTASPSEPPIRTRIEQLIRASGAEVAVAFRTLESGQELFIAPDEVFHAASTMKVPVMIELFRQAEAGQLRLDDPLPVINEFHSIVDHSPYTLDPAGDSDTEVYKHVGGSMTLRQLNEAMITVSSNLAANLLIERLGVENIRRTVRDLKADGMQLLRGVEDSKAFAKGMNNTTTARGLMRLMEAIARGEAVSRQASREMIAVLRRQHFNDGIPAGLPPGTPVAHKTGEITKIHHDAAIVLGNRPFVLVVLVRGIEDQKKSAALMADIARLIYSSMPVSEAGLGRRQTLPGLKPGPTESTNPISESRHVRSRGIAPRAASPISHRSVARRRRASV